VLEPQASGTDVLGDDIIQVDVSNGSQGYIMAVYYGDMENALVQVMGSDANEYRYYLNTSGEYVVIPLVLGSDSYQIVAYEKVQDSKYTFVWKETLEVQMKDENLTFLYPNQYVNFNAQTKAVAKAEELTKGMDNEVSTVSAIYTYVIDNIDYDEEKSETVESGYLPDVDETLKTGKGICFDYAALMTAMLRSRGIPTKLEIGYTGDVYHAWISTYLCDKGWVDNIIEFNGESWRLMDPTFASTGKKTDDKELQAYVTDENNYITKYIH
jgi:hypothetical protein